MCGFYEMGCKLPEPDGLPMSIKIMVDLQNEIMYNHKRMGIYEGVNYGRITNSQADNKSTLKQDHKGGFNETGINDTKGMPANERLETECKESGTVDTDS